MPRSLFKESPLWFVVMLFFFGAAAATSVYDVVRIVRGMINDDSLPPIIIEAASAFGGYACLVRLRGAPQRQEIADKLPTEVSLEESLELCAGDAHTASDNLPERRFRKGSFD